MKKHYPQHYLLKTRVASHKFKNIFILFILFFLNGCLSFDLGQIISPPVEKSDKVKVTVPSEKYEEINNKIVDRAWQNKKNGNTIAYFSECNSPSDNSIENIEKENIKAIINAKVIERKMVDYNSRKALVSIVSGQFNKDQIKVKIVLFKKNGCIFTISYVSRAIFYAADERIFQKFVEDFKIP